MKFFDEMIAIRQPKKSKFDLSHEVKLSFNMGELIPVLTQEVMPGDSFRVSTQQMMRLAPMIAPMMHMVNVYMHYYFVPNRLLWSGWEKFITGADPNAVFPTIQAGKVVGVSGAKNYWKTGGLPDYMGVVPYDGDDNTDAASLKTISALPFRAYLKIYNEYFRDQDLQNDLWIEGVSDAGGPVPLSEYGSLLQLRNRCWEKDYYTSARPWAQKGGSVGIPFTYKDVSDVLSEAGAPISGNYQLGLSGSAPEAGKLQYQIQDGTVQAHARIENLEALASINELREANALQRFLEKLSRSGSRYIEYIKMIFGETSSDSRLQRPEYLGGGRSPIVVSEVLTTYDNTTGGQPTGTMAGHGISVGQTAGFTRSFNEHGYIIGLMSVLPRTGYQQGFEKHWLRRQQFDFPIPDFAHLGEQEVKNSELYVDYADITPGIDDVTFGYQSRYSECKFKNSRSCGDFRTTLAFWHMDRIFATRPTLDALFVQSDPTRRVFAVEDGTQDHLWVNVHHSISAVRPLPYHGTPTL